VKLDTDSERSASVPAGAQRSEPAFAPRRLPWAWATRAVVLVGLVLLPLVANDYVLNVCVLVCLYAFLGCAWNLLAGYAGPFSFGHAAFFGLGAYTSTVLYLAFGLSPWLGMLAGAVVGAAAGLLIGFLCFRSRLAGPFFALGTLAFAEMLRVAVINTDALGGARGRLIQPLGTSVALFQFESRAPYYFIGLLLVALGLLISTRIDRSRMGYYLRAIRENEAAANAAGVDVLRYKLAAMGISSLLTAIGGTFYAQYYLYIDPSLVFGSQMSVEILLRPIAGGAGTVFGPVLGSLVLTPLGEVTRGFLQTIPGLHVLVFGLILVIIVLFMPQGLMGWLLQRARTRPGLAGLLRELGVA
jgi:branched-chain amino acid transport system permease protein